MSNRAMLLMGKSRETVEPEGEKATGALRLEDELVVWAKEVLAWEQSKLPPGQRRQLTMSDVWSDKLRGIIKAAHDAMKLEKEQRERKKH